MPTRIHNPASSPPSPLPRHLTCDKHRPHPAKAGTNCRQVQQSTTGHYEFNLVIPGVAAGIAGMGG